MSSALAAALHPAVQIALIVAGLLGAALRCWLRYRAIEHAQRWRTIRLTLVLNAANPTQVSSVLTAAAKLENGIFPRSYWPWPAAPPTR
jgi:hypothetical protein